MPAVAAYVPTEQLVHVAELGEAEKVPAPHATHAKPVRMKPAGHVQTSVEPLPAVVKPALQAQLVAAAAPVTVVFAPAGHAVHPELFIKAEVVEKVPRGQGVAVPPAQ